MKIPARFIAALLLAAAQAAPAAVIDPMPFLKKDEYGQIKISPTGEYYAVTVIREDRTLLAIMRASDRSITASVGMGENRHVLDFWWVGPERVILSTAEQFGAFDFPFDLGQLNGINVDGTRAEALVGQMTVGQRVGTRVSPKKTEAVYARLVDALPRDDKFVIVSATPFLTDPFTRVERMDAYTGRRSVIGRAPVRNASFGTDNDGVVRFAHGFNADNHERLYHRANDDAEWVLVNDHGQTGIDERPLGFSADNKLAYLLATRAKGPDSIVELELASMKRRDVLRDDDADPRSIIYRAGTRVPVGATFDDAGLRAEFFDKEAPEARLHRSLSKAFPDQAVLVTSQTDDGKKAIVHVWSDRSPGDDYVFDLTTMKADHLLTSRAWLDPDAMGVRKPIAFTARDGLALKGYLTLPHGKDAKHLPMVVLPHGGPFGVADHWGFDSEAQMLASAGYAVMQVNFRGSGGRGNDFANAGRQRWGREMQDDLTDATRWAIEQGIADAKRICLHGASYGAYAALMGVAKEPALYRCASGYVGVYDLPALIRGANKAGTSSSETFRLEWLGNADELDPVSPPNLAKDIKVPVLLAAGGKDTTAPDEQTRIMERALKQAGVPVKTLYYPEEGHGFARIEHQREYYTMLLEFLDAHLGAN